MPRVIIQMVEGRDLEKKRALVKNVTDTMADTLGISKDRISIVLHEMKEDTVAHGGILWCDRDVKPNV